MTRSVAAFCCPWRFAGAIPLPSPNVPVHGPNGALHRLIRLCGISRPFDTLLCFPFERGRAGCAYKYGRLSLPHPPSSPSRLPSPMTDNCDVPAHERSADKRALLVGIGYRTGVGRPGEKLESIPTSIPNVRALEAFLRGGRSLSHPWFSLAHITHGFQVSAGIRT